LLTVNLRTQYNYSTEIRNNICSSVSIVTRLELDTRGAGFNSRHGQETFVLHSVQTHVRWVPCHHGMARPQVAVGGDALQATSQEGPSSMRDDDESVQPGSGAHLGPYPMSTWVSFRECKTVGE
jgi:hypothetical protein